MQPKYLTAFGAIFKMSLFKYKLLWPILGQLFEKIGPLLVPTFGHTDDAKFSLLCNQRRYKNSILHISEILLFHLFCIRSCQIMNDCYLFLLAGWLAGVGQQRLTQKCKEPLSLYLSLFLPLFPSILLYILFTLSFILYLLLSISSLLLSLLLSLSFSVDLDH